MLDDLLLLRLLCARFTSEGSETRSKISQDLLPLAGEPQAPAARWRETFAASVDRLAQAGDLILEGRTRRRLRITDAGVQHARRVFAVPADYSPPAAGWAPWWSKFGLAKALDKEQPPDADGLRAAMLLRFYLPDADPAMAEKMSAAVNLLLARKIGAKATPHALRAAAIRAWVQGTPATIGALPTDDGEFADLIRATARRSAAAQAGGHKVFISHVWRLLTESGQVATGEEHAFKERLIRANTAGMLRLVHADLAEPPEANDVAASETRFLGERFHYVRLD